MNLTGITMYIVAQDTDKETLISNIHNTTYYNTPEQAKVVLSGLKSISLLDKYSIYEIKLDVKEIKELKEIKAELMDRENTKSCWYVYNRRYQPIRDINGNEIDNFEEQSKSDYIYYKSLNIEDDSETILNDYIPSTCDFIVYAHNKRFGFINDVDIKKVSDLVKFVRQNYYKRAIIL